MLVGSIADTVCRYKIKLVFNDSCFTVLYCIVEVIPTPLCFAITQLIIFFSNHYLFFFLPIPPNMVSLDQSCVFFSSLLPLRVLREGESCVHKEISLCSWFIFFSPTHPTIPHSSSKLSFQFFLSILWDSLPFPMKLPTFAFLSESSSSTPYLILGFNHNSFLLFTLTFGASFLYPAITNSWHPDS